MNEVEFILLAKKKKKKVFVTNDLKAKQGNSKSYQRYISHGVHHNSLILHGVLCDPSQPRLQHMVPIQEGLLCSWFHPNLELKTRPFFS